MKYRFLVQSGPHQFKDDDGTVFWAVKVLISHPSLREALKAKETNKDIQLYGLVKMDSKEAEEIVTELGQGPWSTQWSRDMFMTVTVDTSNLTTSEFKRAFYDVPNKENVEYVVHKIIITEKPVSFGFAVKPMIQRTVQTRTATKETFFSKESRESHIKAEKAKNKDLKIRRFWETEAGWINGEWVERRVYGAYFFTDFS